MASTEKVDETKSKSDEQVIESVPATSVPTDEKEAEEDEESDFEDLDDVLDDFNKPKQAAKPEAGEPPLVADSSSANNPSDTLQAVLGENAFDEEQFMKQLEADMMANLLGSNGGKGKASAPTTKTDTESDLPGISEKDIENLSNELKNQGISMEDLIKGILDLPGGPEEQQGTGKSNVPGSSAVGAEREATTGKGEGGTFQDTIQETLKRMQESGDKATAAAATNPDGIPEELFEKFAKLLEAGMTGDAGEDGITDSMQEVFSGIMKDISNKEMLYEPMKEYHAKYGPWLEANRGKVPQEDFARYETQARIVKEIVEKFDEEGYSDEKPECLAYIWDHMQQMEAAGSPPEEVIAKPLIPELPSDGQFPADDQVPPECTPQ